MRPRLILVTGPIASGKSTIARELAAHARSGGFDAAAIDMDDVIFMLNGPDWRSVTPTHWSTARRAAAALAEAFIAEGAQLVTIAGPFFARSERDELISHMRTTPAVVVIALEVTLEEAIARAQRDSTRTLSKDPQLLARLERTINWNELPPDVMRISTNGRDADELASELAKATLQG